MNRDFALAINEYETVESETVKRSPAVEYGYDRKESPYAGCVDCFEVVNRMVYQNIDKESDKK
jgi:hypothetical protein